MVFSVLLKPIEHEYIVLFIIISTTLIKNEQIEQIYIMAHAHVCLDDAVFGATNYSYAASPGHRQDTLTAVFYFANNSSLLMREYRTNQAELNKLEEILRDITVSSALDSIVIEGSSSLIGSFRTNSRLSYERAMAVRSHIRWKFPDVELNEQKIFIKPSVINWGYLFEQVRLDRMVPYRDDLLRILRCRLMKNRSSFR